VQPKKVATDQLSRLIIWPAISTRLHHFFCLSKTNNFFQSTKQEVVCCLFFYLLVLLFFNHNVCVHVSCMHTYSSFFLRLTHIRRYECYAHLTLIIISQLQSQKISRLIDLPWTSRVRLSSLYSISIIYLLTLFFLLLFFSRIPFILSHHHVPPLALVATGTFPTTRQATRGHIIKEKDGLEALEPKQWAAAMLRSSGAIKKDLRNFPRTAVPQGPGSSKAAHPCPTPNVNFRASSPIHFRSPFHQTIWSLR